MKEPYKKTKKQNLGQFYTTNVDYILQGFVIPNNIVIVEPFVGNGDIETWIKKQNGINIEKYDIDPKIDAIHHDTLRTPSIYKDKYVITNPPWLAKNKTKEKEIFDIWEADDLYKIFIKTIILGNVIGGILILPLNFLSDSRTSKIRNLFFSKYHINRINVFEHTVFSDTDYTACSFDFERGEQINPIIVYIFGKPIKKSNETNLKRKIFVKIRKEYNWTIGGELPIFKKIKNSDWNITRLKKDEKEPKTSLFLYAIDSGQMNGRIRLIPNKKHFYGLDGDRAFLTIQSDIKIEDEDYVAREFNRRLEAMREKYHSLFLTNYRHSTKHYARKRITFNLAYNLIEHILADKKVEKYYQNESQITVDWEPEFSYI